MKHLLILVLCSIGTGVAVDHELEHRDLANGQALYREQCASCHGTNLEGQPDWRSPDENGILPAPPHDEAGHT
jgi:mono/diheme cytochrome c family protein